MLRQDKINNLIPKAMEAIEVAKVANEEGIVAKQFEGYIASFGSNISQSGLLPTLIFFQKSSGKEQESFRWLNAIIYVLTNGDKKDGLITYVIENTRQQDKRRYQLSDLDFEKVDALESQIMDIVSALKLAVRTFKIEKDEK